MSDQDYFKDRRAEWEERRKIITEYPMGKPVIRKRKVPLITYINGERKTIGEAVIEQDFSTAACDVSVVVDLLPDTPIVEQLMIILKALNQPETPNED